MKSVKLLYDYRRDRVVSTKLIDQNSPEVVLDDFSTDQGCEYPVI